MSSSGLRTRPVILCRHHLTFDNSVAAVNALSRGGIVVDWTAPVGRNSKNVVPSEQRFRPVVPE